MRNLLKHDRPLLLFLLLTSLYFCVVFIGADFYKTPHEGTKDLLILVFQWSIVSLATFSLLYLLALNKTVFKVGFPVLVFLSAILAYFRYALAISLTPSLLNSVLDNDLKTSIDLISLPLIAFVAVNLIMAILFVLYRSKKITISQPFTHLTIALTLLLLTVGIKSRITAPIQHRIPFCISYSIKNYFINKAAIQKDRSDQTADAVSLTDSLIVVYVQGESLRADHLHLNGYLKQTTPQLDQDSVISFSNIYNPYTTTDESLPYILSDADSLHPQFAYTHRSFISFFNRCGYASYWIANQEPATAFMYFTKEAAHTIHINEGKTVYNFEPYTWLDTQMDSSVRRIVQQRSGNSLLILHTIGSHWWYKAHYSKQFEKFRPVIESRNILSSTTEQLINTYDNTVLQTDAFLHDLIQQLKGKKAILIYLSDHGEALGENGHWLHATDASPIHYPACIVWMSDSYKAAFPEREAILTANKNKYFNSSFLFHSILDAAMIKTRIFKPQFSIFRTQ